MPELESISKKNSLELPKNLDFQAILAIYQDYLQNSNSNPVEKINPEHSMLDSISQKINAEGMGVESFLGLLNKEILAYSKNLHSPSYMGHQVPPSLPFAVMIDMLVSGWNQSLVVSRMSPIMTLIEKELISFLAKSFGFSDNAKGTMTSGGSASNILGVLCARNKVFKGKSLDNAVVLCSEQSHYSIKKAAFICGINTENVISLPCNENFVVDTAEIQSVIDKVKISGKIPFAVCVNSGSTSTGSFDNLEEISEICRKNNLWLHVDAAHGGSLIFSEKYRHLLSGIEKADSISFDGHKMMFMPSSTGVFLVKNGFDLTSCFQDIDAAYLYNNETDEYDLSRLSLQCTRRADALKLWGSLVAYGTEFFAKRHEYLAKLASYFYKKILSEKDFEPLNNPEFNIFCFRYVQKSKTEAELNEINYKIRDIVNSTGKLMITLTTINEKIYLRATLINPATTEENIDRAINLIKNNCLGLTSQ